MKNSRKEVDVILALQDIIARKNKLISELCDALYDHLKPRTSKILTPAEKLLQRAREEINE